MNTMLYLFFILSS